MQEVVGGDPKSRLLVPWGFLSADIIETKVASRIKRLTEGKYQGAAAATGTIPYLGDQHTNDECKELFAEFKDDFAEGVPQAYRKVVETFLRQRVGEAPSAASSFTNHNYCSPDLSSFLDDVKKNNAEWGLQPLLSVSSIEAKLCSLRFEKGFLCKNKYIGGLMSNQEAMMHVLEGVVGPEGQLLQEIEGNIPRRLVAEVEISVVEKFRFLDPETKETMVWPPPPPTAVEEGDQHEGLSSKEQEVSAAGEKRKHFFTFETDWHGRSVEWVITNINDVIVTPSLSAVQEW